MYLLRGGYPPERPEFGGSPGAKRHSGGPRRGFWPPKAADSGGLGVHSGGSPVGRRPFGGVPFGGGGGSQTLEDTLVLGSFPNVETSDCVPEYTMILTGASNKPF